MSTYDHGNLRFQTHSTRQGNWYVNVTRISDGHFLGQDWFVRDVEDHEWPELAAEWMDKHPGAEVAPEPTLCRSCKEPLQSSDDTDYQFDNALWLTASGGYGMFVEDDSFMLVGDFWRSLPEDTRRTAVGHDDIGPCPMPLPDSLKDQWNAWFNANRTDRVVICHDCAHALCDAAPWIAEWLNPQRSHSHRQDYKDAHPDHDGWDYRTESENA